MKNFLKSVIDILIAPVFLLICIPCAIIARIVDNKAYGKSRLVWGSTPIINYSIWSDAMHQIGYNSKTFTTDYYSTINERDDWDLLISEKYPCCPRVLKPYVAFVHSLFNFDIYFISFDGFFLGESCLKKAQAQLLKLAGKKIIIMPYGSDSYAYKNIKSIYTLHGLLMSYPRAARKQVAIQNNVDYWCKWADAVIPASMGPDGFGRWDVLVPNTLVLDLNKWTPSSRMEISSRVDKVTIAHAPNHRGFKGTEFIIHAVEKLKSEGYNIEFIMLEKIKNSDVRRILCNQADILVEQIIATGSGLNGLEGMAAGLPTISNLEDDNYIVPMRRWSYFGECPLVSATPENLVDVLRKLVTRPELRKQLGRAGRKYVEKYHGYDSAQYLFTNVIDYAYGRKESLINLYHPLLGEYPNRSPKIQHPLKNNRIVD